MDDTIPKDPQFQAAFASATVSKIELARYYLRCLEMAAKGEPDPCFTPNEDATIINLEHVLPRNPEGNWPGFSHEEVEASYRRVGNMVLLQSRANSDLKSAAFTEKSVVYAQSPYLLTSQVAERQEWTVETINERQQALSELACRTWPLLVR